MVRWVGLLPPRSVRSCLPTTPYPLPSRAAAVLSRRTNQTQAPQPQQQQQPVEFPLEFRFQLSDQAPIHEEGGHAPRNESELILSIDMAKKAESVYAVRRGRKTGVFGTWAEAEAHIRGFPGAVHRKFSLAERDAALQWVKGQSLDQVQGSRLTLGARATASGSTQQDPEDSRPSKKQRKEFPEVGSDHQGLLYAVRVGRQRGLFSNWETTQALTMAYPNAEYKKFTAGQYVQAKAWVEHSTAAPQTRQIHQPPVPRDGLVGQKTVQLADGEVPSRLTLSTYAQTPDARTTKWHKIQGRFPEYIRSVLFPFALSEPEAVTNGKVNVWCDGSSLSNGKSSARAGWGVYFPSSSAYAMQSEARPLPGDLQTNNRGELMAIGRVCEIVPPNIKVRIHSDSQYSIKALSDWSQKWEKNGWVTAKGEEVQNRDLLMWIQDLFAQRQTKPELVYVKGHATNVGNLAADCLARRGASLNNA